MPAGRPTKYKPEYAEQAYNYCLLGADDKRLAVLFDTTETTINTWKKKHPEFLKSIKKGKDIADAEVTKSLYQRATGYSHPEDKIFNNAGKEMIVKTEKHYPPDPVACIFWLKNRQKENWRDTKQLDGTVNHVHKRELTDLELAQELGSILTQGQAGKDSGVNPDIQALMAAITRPPDASTKH